MSAGARTHRQHAQSTTELKQQTEECAKQFKDEARAMLLCAQPHVVTLIGTVGSCILMGTMDCDLGIARLYNGLLPPQTLAAVAKDILMALARMHE